VILLDDIVSELDERRRAAVLNGLTSFDQVWLTATDASSFGAALGAAAGYYRVESGTVSPA
jgi:recombinational DNA repair ATPase RecF